MKKVFLAIFIALVLVGAYLAWQLLGPATNFEAKQYHLEIPTGSSYEDLITKLDSTGVLSHLATFDLLARQFDYPSRIRAGRYTIQHGANILSIFRKLRNGTQEPVNLVITKLRTKEDFASLAGRKLEFDSLAMIRFLNSNDSLSAYGLDSNTVMAGIMPDTYTYYWNTTPSKVIQKVMKSRDIFWTEERRNKAKAKGLTPEQVVTLASIVEEETNQDEEKGTIASVYLNRLQKGMRLGADPTVKFALRDFSLKRIYNKHLAVESPWNTYRVTGLPPGPICTPQAVTIDAVLSAPNTNYLYFVARADFSGKHVFAETYDQHLKYAKEYQLALDAFMKKKNKPEETGNGNQ